MTGGSVGGCDHVTRCFHMLLAIQVMSFQSNTQFKFREDMAVKTVEKLVNAKLDTPERIANADEDAIKKGLRSINKGLPTEWLKPLASVILNKHGGMVPSTTTKLKELPHVSPTAVRMVPQDCFGFFPGIVLDLTCRKMSIALQFVDVDEFRKKDEFRKNEFRKKSIKMEDVLPAKIEASLKTWPLPHNYQVFTEVLGSIAQVLFEKPEGNDRVKRMEKVQKAITECFPPESRRLLRECS